MVLERIRPFTSLSVLKLRTITLCHNVHFQIPRLLVHHLAARSFGQRVTRQRVCIRMQPSVLVCYGVFILHQLHGPPGKPACQVLLRLEPTESMMIRHNSNWPPPNEKSKLFHCPHQRETLLLRDRVVSFTCRHYTTCEGQGPLFSHLSLHQHRPNAVSASVRVNLKLQTVVWVGQHCRVCEPFL